LISSFFSNPVDRQTDITSQTISYLEGRGN